VYRWGAHLQGISTGWAAGSVIGDSKVCHLDPPVQVPGAGTRRCVPKIIAWAAPLFGNRSFATEDPDLEYAPVVPEMGTIEVRAYRCQAVRIAEYQRNLNYGLHQGRISERSKKAGWHHVRYFTSQATRPILIHARYSLIHTALQMRYPPMDRLFQ
jgi:hypothetical protein